MSYQLHHQATSISERRIINQISWELMWVWFSDKCCVWVDWCLYSENSNVFCRYSLECNADPVPCRRIHYIIRHELRRWFTFPSTKTKVRRLKSVMYRLVICNVTKHFTTTTYVYYYKQWFKFHFVIVCQCQSEFLNVVISVYESVYK